MNTVLHLLAQRPSATGSGITLEALVHGAQLAGYEQHVVCGVPATEPEPQIAGLPAHRIHPLLFETEQVRFAVPGMSDVMPYPSTRFASLTDSQWQVYCDAWRAHLESVISEVQPDVIHAHHVWLMSSLVKEIAPRTPLVIHSHATGLRQMVLCAKRATEIRNGCARADHYCVLHAAHERALVTELGVPKSRVSIVGAGYRQDLFHSSGRPNGDEDTEPTVLYVGKLSAAKGVSELIAAFARVHERMPAARLHVVGSGAGSEGEWIARELAAQGESVVVHGQLDQAALAEVMRKSSVCVLPSYYEGLPLVLVEAAASGCRLVSTALPGVVDELAPHLGDRLTLVPLPALLNIDQPKPEALPRFVSELALAVGDALSAPRAEFDLTVLEPFTWRAVFARVEKIWSRVSTST